MIDDILVKVSGDKKKEIAKWVEDEINNCLEGRISLEKRWEKWIKQYEEIIPEKKSFPWDNASNVSIPITPVDVETIHAREFNTLFSIRPYIQIKPKRKGINKDTCVQLERFLDQVLCLTLKIYKKGSHWLLEKDKMGTSFIKLYWEYDRYKTGPNEFTTKDDAAMDVIAIEDLLFPANAKDLQSCQWVAHRVYRDWNYISCKGKQGVYKDIDKIKPDYKTETSITPTGADIVGMKEKIENIDPPTRENFKEYEIYEVWFDYDIDDDGYSEPTVMTFHKDSGTILRWIWNPRKSRRRPFIENKYTERTNRVYGKGICEMDEYLQEAINTVFNQTIDNATIANIKCFKGRKNARKDIGKIYPGKVFWVDDPTDITEFTLGEIHQSNFVIHSLLREYAERRTKVNDYTLGRESSIAKTRATATGTLALLQESGRHFDLIINNSREALVELAYQVIELYYENKPEKIYYVTERDEEIMLPELNPLNIREEYEFYCTATSMTVNKEIEKQTSLLLIQQLSNIYNQVLRLIMMLNNQQMVLPQPVQQYVIGMIESYYAMAKDLLRSFEKIDTNSYLPEIEEIVQQAYGQGQLQQIQQAMQGMMGGLLGQGGTDTGMEGFGQMQGMGNIPETPEGAEGEGITEPLRGGPVTRPT